MEEALKYLQSPMGPHTAARVDGDEWTYTTEELAELLAAYAERSK